jgi:hypothetical protein
MKTDKVYLQSDSVGTDGQISWRYRDNENECGMNAPQLRNYRVSLVGYGVYAVWVTAESRRAACDLAERMWRETRSVVPLQDGVIEYVEILDEYEEGSAG